MLGALAVDSLFVAKQSVSILMSCFNSSHYVREAVESVLNQTHSDFKFVIVDDGSTDDTVAICREYAERDSRIRLLPLPKNIGAPAALNFGLDYVNRDWVLRFDPDDVMLPNRIERQLAFLDERPELSVASSLAVLIDADGNEIGRSRSPYTDPETVAKTIAGPTLIGFLHPAAAIRTRALRSVGGYRKEYWPTEDLDLWARLSEAGYQMLVQDECLIQYRQHGGSISFGANRRQVLAMEWAQNSKARRRAGQKELSLDEYLATEQKRPLLAKLNQNRRVSARTLYKAGLLHYAMGQRALAAGKIAVATLMEPALVAPRIWARVWPRPIKAVETNVTARRASAIERQAA